MTEYEQFISAIAMSRGGVRGVVSNIMACWRASSHNSATEYKIIVCPDMSSNPFRYFKTSPEIDVSHETVRYWWNRFGPIFAAEIRRKRARHLQARSQWRWHLDEGAPRRR